MATRLVPTATGLRRLAPALLAAAAAATATAAAPSVIEPETLKLLPGDGAFNDRFGFASGLSGTTAILGAPLADDRGFDAGAAYLLDVVTGETIAKLLPDEDTPNGSFGVSVAIDGGVAIVGAPGDATNGDGAGAAYLFDTVTGERLAKLLPDDAAEEDLFGISVDVSGTVAIVGAYLDDDAGLEAGAAYLFDVATGAQLFKLLAEDGAAGDRFGLSVAIDGDTAIVGSFLDDDDGPDSGSAYLFDVATGAQLGKLRAPDGAADDAFGAAVAIDGGTALVGAFQDDDGGQDAGSASLFDVAAGTRIAKLVASDGEAFAAFGISVAIEGGTAVIGAYLDGDNGLNAGSAYRFDAASGDELAKLLPSDGAAVDSFGISVAVDGRAAVVGAYLDDDNGTNSGSAYRFGAPAPPCPADLDQSGTVDLDDLLGLLAAWDGPGADLDGDGTTSLADLLVLLAAWGPCASG